MMQYHVVLRVTFHIAHWLPGVQHDVGFLAPAEERVHERPEKVSPSKLLYWRHQHEEGAPFFHPRIYVCLSWTTFIKEFTLLMISWCRIYNIDETMIWMRILSRWTCFVIDDNAMLSHCDIVTFMLNDDVAWSSLACRRRPNSDGLQPNGNGLQPNRNGLQPIGDGLQPNSDGLQSHSNGLQPNSSILKELGWHSCSEMRTMEFSGQLACHSHLCFVVLSITSQSKAVTRKSQRATR